MTDTPCSHNRTIPIEVATGTDERRWNHWCADCGAISQESNFVDQPREPWTLPGELEDADVSRINRAATES